MGPLSVPVHLPPPESKTLTGSGGVLGCHPNLCSLSQSCRSFSAAWSFICLFCLGKFNRAWFTGDILRLNPPPLSWRCLPDKLLSLKVSLSRCCWASTNERISFLGTVPCTSGPTLSSPFPGHTFDKLPVSVAPLRSSPAEPQALWGQHRIHLLCSSSGRLRFHWGLQRASMVTVEPG